MNEKNEFEHYAMPFCTRDGKLCIFVNEEKTVPLCTFAPRIVKQLTVHDSEKTLRLYQIGGTNADGEEITPIEIPASELNGMQWIDKYLDVSCYLCLVKNAKKYVYHAIKSTGNSAEKINIYAHTGWEEINGKWNYLLPGFGDNTVSLVGKQNKYHISNEATEKDIRSVANLLDSGIMPDEVLLPCLSLVFLSPLNEFFHQAGYEPKFILALIGHTGSMKSTVAALMLSFFGNFSATDLPMSFNDTENSILHSASALKDVLTCVDDYYPTTKTNGNIMKKTMQELARGIGDRASRNRLTSSIKLRDSKPPQGNVIVTAEFAPDVKESGTSRFFCIEMKPKSIDLKLLTEAQNDARNGCFANCMGEYIRNLLKEHLQNGQDASSLVNLLGEQFVQSREKWRQELKRKKIDFHDRIPDTLAWLELGFDFLISFLYKMKVIDEFFAKSLQARMNKTICLLAKKQSEAVEADRPTHIFIRKLYSLIECGKVSLVPKNCGISSSPKNFIGYEDSKYLYLMLDVSHKEVKQLCDKQDEGFAISSKSLAKALADEGLIETKNGSNTQPMRFGGLLKRVMILDKEKASKLLFD